jgi:hypothetical protein
MEDVQYLHLPVRNHLKRDCLANSPLVSLLHFHYCNSKSVAEGSRIGLNIEQPFSKQAKGALESWWSDLSC